MKISQTDKTRIFREMVQSGNYIREIPTLSRMMGGKRTRRNRKRKTRTRHNRK